MKEHKDAFDAIDALQQETKQYAELRIELLKAEAAEKVALASGQLIAFMCIGILFLVTIIFLSIVGGLYFTDIFGSAIKGFGIIAVFYLFISIILFVFRKTIFIMPIGDRVISILYQEEENEES